MRISPKSIRFRLIAWYVFSLGSVHLIVAAALYPMLSASLHHELDQRLATYTTCLVELLPQHRQLDLAEVVGEMAGLIALGPDLYVRVANPEGRVIYETTGAPPQLAARLRDARDTSRHTPQTLRVPGVGPWRAIIRRVDEGGQPAYVGHVAIPLRGVQQALARLQLILFVVVPVVLLLASLGAWALINRALRPLKEAIRTAQAIQAKDFTQRLRVPITGDEVQLLAETFNEMIARLQSSFAQMRQFISDASHELRTPLAVLKGEIELGLKAQSRLDDGQQTMEVCASEIQRMSRLVDTLLFLSHADAEKIALDLKPIPLSRMMEEIAEQARILAEPKGIFVGRVNGSNAFVQADEMRLKQLLLNLVGNAVKFTPEGGRITLGCRSKNGRMELFVADTGIGIEQRDLPRIFDRFYRADKSRSRAEGGYGLGLSICKWIAEAHRGSIRVESAPGKGSTFSVILPAASLAAVPGTAQPGAARPPSA